MNLTKLTGHRQLLKRTVIDYVAIYVGILIYSVGFTVFILPHEVVIGGMAGLGTLIFYASREYIPVAVAMYGVNLILLLCGFRVLGKSFVWKTVYGFSLLSLTVGSMEGYFTSHAPLIQSQPMSIAIGAVLMGLGIGIYYSRHGTAGGTDIVAAILNNKANISVGRVMMIFDFSVVACSFFLPFDGDMEARVQVRSQTIIYGWVTVIVYSQLVDYYLAQGRQTVQFMIISRAWERIAYRISHEVGRGVTLCETRGYWTGDKHQMLISWCHKPDVSPVLRIIHEEDTRAYVVTSYVGSIFGEGFDFLKIRHKKRKQTPQEAPDPVPFRHFTEHHDAPQQEPTETTTIEN